MLHVSVAWVTHPSAPGPLDGGWNEAFYIRCFDNREGGGGDYYLPTIIKGTGFIAPPYFLIDLNYTSVSAAAT